MCGIVGYIGRNPAIPLLIAGLEKLAYRGYDSAGVASVENSKIAIYRAEGKLSRLKEVLEKEKLLDLSSKHSNNLNLGIGHTRWATHGRPSETNAHPHVAGKVCVVHNGIIENYRQLRDKLEKLGARFTSETDTEIAAHLISYHYEKSGNLFSALKSSVAELQGSYALVVCASDNNGSIVVAKNSTPIVIGIKSDETFIASDITAILEHTRDIIILEDGDVAEVREDGVRVEGDGNLVERPPIKVTWDPITAEKGGYRHFMLKEIHEQPQVVAQTFRPRLKQEQIGVFLDDVNFNGSDYRKFERVFIVACGTAWHAALITRYYIEKLAGVPVEVDYGSEFRYRENLLNDKTLFMVISQSGETADTLGALARARDANISTLAICNVVGSSISRMAENVLYTNAGPEISVASTKAFVTQLTAGYLLALRFAIARNTITEEQAKKHLDDLMHLPSLLTTALSKESEIEKISKEVSTFGHFLYLGRGLLYPIALEGALKLKEISYVHAEGYPAGEMKHGPIALVNEELPVVAVIGHDGINYEKTLSNLMEVYSRGGKIIAITDIETSELKRIATHVIPLGEIPQFLLPIVFSIPLQLFAYHVALSLGTDVDQPRNLAKSVTVE